VVSAHQRAGRDHRASLGDGLLVCEPLENRGKFPLSEMRTALVGDAGVRFAVGHAWAAVATSLLRLTAAVVPTGRLAALAGQGAALSSTLVAQSALASPSSALGGLASLSVACSSDLARLFSTLVDDSLASMRIFVLKLCFVSCLQLGWEAGKENDF
jgi:hypothetical protein